MRQTGFFVTFFALSSPWQPRKSKFWKLAKTYYHFTNVHYKWKSSDVWFLSYGAQVTFFCHFRPFFCSFTPLITQKTKILKMYLLNANMHLIRIKKPHQLYLLSSFYIKCATKQCKYPKLIYSMSNKKGKTQIHKLQGDRQIYTDR